MCGVKMDQNVSSELSLLPPPPLSQLSLPPSLPLALLSDHELSLPVFG